MYTESNGSDPGGNGALLNLHRRKLLQSIMVGLPSVLSTSALVDVPFANATTTSTKGTVGSIIKPKIALWGFGNQNKLMAKYLWEQGISCGGSCFQIQCGRGSGTDRAGSLGGSIRKKDGSPNRGTVRFVRSVGSNPTRRSRLEQPSPIKSISYGPVPVPKSTRFPSSEKKSCSVTPHRQY